MNRTIALVFLVACNSSATDTPPGTGVDASSTIDVPMSSDAPVSAACSGKLAP